MNTTLQYSILKELCPERIWQLTDAMKLTLDYQISRLPRRTVSDLETRYPTTLADMRAFLEVFFTRHLFQVQNSLIDYMTSEDFLSIAASGHLRILDIGSGPAVASLAITDVLSCILEHLEHVGVRPKGKIVEATYILNDTSGVCLGTGQDMLNNYFRIGRGHNTRIVKGRMFSIGRAFPDNINQLERIKLNLGTYDIVVFSYVISPLNEERGFDRLINGL